MELSAAAQSWIHLILVWVGFGTVVGFAANLFLPAGKPIGFFSNLVVGIMGSCAGPIAFVIFFEPKNFHPMSPIGFAIAVFTAIVLIVLYRVIMVFVPKSPPVEKQTIDNQKSKS